MKVYYSGDKVEFKKTAVALGNFDGLHIAHMKIIDSCISYAQKKKIKSGVLLFDHHSTEITKSRNVALIMPNNYKLDILEKAGVDFVYLIRFDSEFMRRTPSEFILFLKDMLHMSCVSVGYDYRFGYKALGNTDMLKDFGREYDFDTLICEKITLDGELVGSTYIRSLINNGEIEKATKYLGRYFFMDGVVVSGLQNGRKMGFPTANIDYNMKMIVPPDGVYAGIATIENKKYKCVINIGNNPTFNAVKKTIEAHILDFNNDIYGEKLKIELVKRLRDEMKFTSIDDLKKQISQDTENARNLNLF